MKRINPDTGDVYEQINGRWVVVENVNNKERRGIPALVRSPGPKQPESSYMRGLLGAGTQGATFELGEELRAGINTMGDIGRGALGMPGGIDVTKPGNVTPRYKAHRDILRGEQAQFDAENPAASFGARMVGGAGTAGTLSATGLLGQGSRFGQYAQGHPWKAAAAGGGLSGAITGAGMAPEMSDVPGSAGVGGLAGAAGGLGTMGAIRGLAKGFTGAKRAVQNQLNQTTPRSEGAAAVRRALERDAIPDVASAQRSMRELGPEGRLIDTGSGNIQNLAATVAGSPGKGQQVIPDFLGARKERQFPRLLNSLRKATGKSGEYFGSFRKLIEYRAQEAGKYYKPAEKEFADPERVRSIAKIFDDAIDAFDSGPIASRLRSLRRQLFKTQLKGQNTPPVPKTNVGKALHAYKRTLDAEIRKAYQKEGGGGAEEMVAARRALLEVMDDASPNYAKARQIFSDESSVIDAMELGRKAFNEDAEELAGTIAEMSAAEKDAFLLGATKAIRDKVGSLSDFSGSGANPVYRLLGNQNARDAMRLAAGSDEAYDKLVKAIGREGKFSEVTQAVIANSKTFARQQNVAQTGGEVPTSLWGAASKVVSKALSKMMGDDSLSEPVRDQVARILVEVPADQVPAELGKLRLPPDVYQKLVRDFGASGSILAGYAAAQRSQ